MTDQDWLKWLERHSTLFGLTSEADLLMLDAWRDVFTASGYTVAELHEASLHIASNGPPRWRSEHLIALHTRIRLRRTELLRAADAEFDRQQGYSAECQDCGNSGMAIVPHLLCVRDDQWRSPFLTMAVSCQCQRGQRFRDAYFSLTEDERKKSRAKLQMSLAAYEPRNPDWRTQVVRRRESMAANVRARAVTAEADRFGPLSWLDSRLLLGGDCKRIAKKEAAQ